jgi:hypothetical protein
MQSFNSDKIQFIAIIGSVIFLLFVISLVRNKRIKEEYSLLWLFFGIVFIVISVFNNLLLIISSFIGIAYPPIAYLLILIMAIFLILIQYSVVISDLKEKNKTLTQEIGILKMKIERILSNNNKDIQNDKKT